MGLLIIAFDAAVARVRAVGDYEPLPRPGGRPVPPAPLSLPNILAVRNQAAVRTFLWPLLAVISGCKPPQFARVALIS
jgi:hypothetical protein